MTFPFVPGGPRIGSRINATPRRVFAGGTEGALPGGRLISGACSRDPGNTGDVDLLRAGLLMGKITTVVNSLGTVGHFATSILGVTTNAEAAGSTTIESSAAIATELVRRRGTTGTFNLIGPGVAGGPVQTELVTYSAANTTSGDLTVTAIANNFVAGSFICPTDGSQEPITFLPDGWPIQVTDVDRTTNLVNEFPEMPVAGIIDSSQLINWPSDTSLQQWIVDRLSRAAGGKFVFDHLYNP